MRIRNQDLVTLCLSWNTFRSSRVDYRRHVMQSSALEGRFEQTLKVSGRVRLDVAIDSGLVRVTTGADELVQVRGIIRSRRVLRLGSGDMERRIHELETNMPIEQNGNAIAVEYRGDRWFTGGILLLLDI